MTDNNEAAQWAEWMVGTLVSLRVVSKDFAKAEKKVLQKERLGAVRSERASVDGTVDWLEYLVFGLKAVELVAYLEHQ